MLRELRDAAGLSQEQVAEATGISVSQISRYEAGERDPKLAHLEAIAGLFKVTVGRLLGEPVPIRVPLLSAVSAGKLWGRDAVYGHDALRVVTVTDLPPGDWFALEVEGDSMDRIAPPGAIIIVRKNDDKLVNDRFFVFGTPQGEATFKRYRSRPDRLVPYSFNPDHEPIYPDGELLTIGRVHRIIKDV